MAELEPEREQQIRDSIRRQTLLTTLGVEVAEVSSGRVALDLPFRADLCQQNGYLHAGAVTAVADSACGYAALTQIPDGRDVLTVEFKVVSSRSGPGVSRITATCGNAGRADLSGPPGQLDVSARCTVASIVKKPRNSRKPWTVRWTAEGHQRERSFETLRQAREYRTQVEHSIREHTYTDPKLASIKFVEYAGQWVRGPRAETTRRSYEQAVRLILTPWYGARTLKQVANDRESGQRLMATLTPGRQSVASTVLVGALNEAVRAGRIPKHRLSGLQIASAGRRAKLVTATREQLETVADALPGNAWISVWLMRGTGVRVGEALGITPADFRGTSLRVERQIREDGTIGPLKHRKPGQFRDVPLPGYLAKMAEGWSGYTATNRSSYQRGWTKGRKAAGLPASFTPHALRHWYASITLARGIPITDLARFLGHESIETTFQLYSWLVASAEDRTRAALDEEWREF